MSVTDHMHDKITNFSNRQDNIAITINLKWFIKAFSKNSWKSPENRHFSWFSIIITLR